MKRLQSLRHLLLALPLLAALLCTSCQRHSAVWPQLLEAEALLDTDLPAAASLLDSLDAAPLRGEDAALYAILKTQADYKRYVPLTSDSLPRLATAYYGTPYRKNYHAAMAWYSLGCCYLDQRSDMEAIDAFLKAKSLYPDTLSRYYALCEQQLGKLYMVHHLYAQSLNEYTSYKHAAVQNGDPKLMAMADYYCSLANIRVKRFEEAKSLLMPLTDTTSLKFRYYNDVFLQLGKTEYLMNNLEESKAYLNRYIRGEQDPTSLGVAYLFMGKIFFDTQRFDSAQYYCARALQCDNDLGTQCEANKILSYTNQLVKGDTVSFDYAANYTILLDSIYRQSNKSEIASIQSSHTLELQAQSQKIKRQRFIFLTLLAAVLLLSAGAMALLSYHRRKEKRYIAYSEKMRESICEQIKVQVDSETEEDESDDGEEGMAVCPAEEKVVQDVSEESFDPLVFALREERIQCCREQFSKSEWDIYLRKKHAAILRGEYMRADDQEIFREYVSKLFSGITLELIHESKKMNGEYLFICQLSMLGLSGKAIGHCISATSHSVYCRKTRIKERLNEEWSRHIFHSVKEKYGV